MFIDQKAIDYFSTSMVLAKLNAEEDSSYVKENGDTTSTAVKTAICREFKVSGYPTLVLINPDGTEIDRIIGFMEVDDLIETLDNYQNGIGTLDDLLSKAKESDDRALFFEIGDKYKYRGEPESATAWYSKVIEEGDTDDSLSGQSLMALADMDRRAGNYEAALERYKAVEKDLKDTPFGMDAVIYQAIVYRSMADTANAIETFERYIEQFPDSPDVDYAKGQIERLRGESPE